MNNHKELIAALRNKESRDNRELLDSAADAIAELITERNKAIVLLKQYVPCGICKHKNEACYVFGKKDCFEHILDK